ncbi:4Fe-4S dicluster domain-containing protein [Thermanaeromonas sp. C210]|uniref:4Fe-4S dicluster domain-containing protein n=1 Tax=Thermanaeromonas sp. C210 TaxID=2731925 RepID=UPI00155B9C2A|nr:4Fe-4S dicluster domain-containing protein [Thermanaeromonas sp. C210]GFN24176.1 4Fe-4S ferredoxin [Thermanaeromonas sp. C210]
MRFGMIINLRRCVGCSACVVACRAEHGTPPGAHRSRVLRYETGRYPVARMRFLPLLCMQCNDPPCLKACPTGATKKLDSGTVIIESSKCIGCRACMVACPYGSRSFLFKKEVYYGETQKMTPYEEIKSQGYSVGTAIKCDFCLERVKAGRQPACVDTCPAAARTFGDLDDPRSEIVRMLVKTGAKPLYPELGTKPAVYYIDVE